MSDRISHVVITPARNEAENLARLGESLAEQSWPPAAWIVVDNGSTDETADVMAAFSASHPWARLLTIPAAGPADRGPASVRALNAGIRSLTGSPFLVTNADADISFEPSYFERLRAPFEKNEALGMAAGRCYEQQRGAWQPVYLTGPSLRGAALTFRWECLQDQFPIEEKVGWDGIAIIRARIRGWQTELLSDLSFRHHRRTMGRERRFAAWSREGEIAYYMWYRPAYLLTRSLFWMLRGDPAAAGLVWGYAKAGASRAPRQPDPGFRQAIRELQAPRQYLARGLEALGRRRS